MAQARVALAYGQDWRQYWNRPREEVAFLLAVSRAEEETRWNRLERALGVLWTLADVMDPEDAQRAKAEDAARRADADGEDVRVPPSVMRVPLALALNNDLYEHVAGVLYPKRRVSSATVGQNMEVVELGDLPLEQAQAFFRNAAAAVQSLSAQEADAGRRRPPQAPGANDE